MKHGKGTNNKKNKSKKINKNINKLTRKSNHRKYNHRKSKPSKSSGGRAIDAGSYGCVFNPAIKCTTSSTSEPYNSKNISKLMYAEDTQGELDEMAKVKKIIADIPNKENYFIISNTYACSPDKLGKEDLMNFDNECYLFTKRGITSANVNSQLNKLSLIVMPNGGLNIEKFMVETVKLADEPMYSTFAQVNEALIQLLINGIVQLNARKFNHYDIKYANILMGSDGHARLIDWGLAGENDGNRIPEAIQDRSIAFNMPFSDIFFNKYVKNWLPEALNKIKSSAIFNNKTAGQAELLKIVAINMINKSIEQTSEGHYDYIVTGILHDIYKIYAIQNNYNRLDYNVLSYNAMIEYIQAVLLTYVDENGNFNDTKYFYEVFAKNVDIWGFLLSYVPMIEHGVGHFHPDIINGICRILLKYCFSSEFAAKPIDVNELVLDLRSLNIIANDIIQKIQKVQKMQKIQKKNTIIKPNKQRIEMTDHMLMKIKKQSPTQMTIPSQVLTHTTNIEDISS